jgi:hypothetical protein
MRAIRETDVCGKGFAVSMVNGPWRSVEVIRLGLPDGRRLEIEHKHLWSLTTRLVAEHRSVAHAVSTAADLRLALKGLGQDGEIMLDERQARAVLAVSGATVVFDPV